MSNNKPVDMQIQDPQNYPIWNTHLLWMMDNKPEQTKDLHLKKGLLTGLSVQNRKLKEDQIQEVLLAMVAPADGPDLNGEVKKHCA